MKIIDCTPTVATALAYDQDTGSYRILTEYSQKPESGPPHKASPPVTCPLQAWTSYWELTDCLMRRRIGSALAKQGKNRYTGKTERSDTIAQNYCDS